MAKGQSDAIQAAAIRAAVQILTTNKSNAGMETGEMAIQVASLAYAIVVRFSEFAKDGFDLPK